MLKKIREPRKIFARVAGWGDVLSEPSTLTERRRRARRLKHCGDVILDDPDVILDHGDVGRLDRGLGDARGDQGRAPFGRPMAL